MSWRTRFNIHQIPNRGPNNFSIAARSYEVRGVKVLIRGVRKYTGDDEYTRMANGEMERVINDYILANAYEITRSPATKYVPPIRQIVVDFEGTSANDQVLSDDDYSNRNKEGSMEFEVRDPLWTLNEVYLPKETRTQIISVLSILSNRDRLFNDWGLKRIVRNGRGIVLNFFGPPGTGKTITAEAIANHLGKKVMIVSYAELESKYVGETPKNIKRAFTKAAEANAVLVFDEADSFLGRRLTNVSQAADYGVNVTRSTMFMEIEHFPGVLVFTTNLIQNYDKAFMRRILANISFGYPDRDGREALWRLHIPDSLPLESHITPSLLANRYDNLSGADIRDAVLNAAAKALSEGTDLVTLSHIDYAVNLVRARNQIGSSIE